MKTIRISTRSKSLNRLLQQAKRGNLILRTASGLEFILAEVNDFDREIKLTRENKKLMDLLDKRAKSTETVSGADARVRLGLAAK